MSFPPGSADPLSEKETASERATKQPKPATPEDAEQITSLFVEVFGTDPVWSAIAPDATVRSGMIERSFQADLSCGGEQDFDVIRDEDGGVVGALHFTSPGRRTPQEQQTADDCQPQATHDQDGRSQSGSAPEANDAEPGSVPREISASSSRCWAHDQAVHAYRPQEPHWYFRDLVISPSVQGAGLGSALLGERLRVVDKDPAPVFLESTSPASRRLYERFGFEHVATVEAVPGGRAYVMVRPAQQS